MDFFDNAIEKTKEAFDIAKKKTGEVVSNEKQRFDIASLKTKLEKDYARLGLLCYETLKDDASASAPIKEAIVEITLKKEKIEQLTEELAAAKAKRVCPNCSAIIDKNAVYCSICGTKLSFEG